MNKKAIYSSLLRDDIKYVSELLEEAGFETQTSSSLLDSHVYLNSASTEEVVIYVNELFYADAKHLLEKNDLVPIVENLSSRNRREVNYLHDSLRLAIFGMLVVPLVLNVISIYKLYLAVSNKEFLKYFTILQIIIFNTIGICFWGIVLYKKFFLS